MRLGYRAHDREAQTGPPLLRSRPASIRCSRSKDTLAMGDIDTRPVVLDPEAHATIRQRMRPASPATR
jgi:hypothetical protein